MNENPEIKFDAAALRGRRTAAAVLLVVASAALALPHLPFNWRDGMLLLMGAGFIIWSALARVRGLLVPGCVLTGIGAGMLLRGELGNGALLLGMAGGFLLLGGLSRAMFGKCKGDAWPLWPAGGLTLAGLLSYAGADFRHWMRAAGPFWPYVLIVVALFLLLAKPAQKE